MVQGLGHLAGCPETKAAQGWFMCNRGLFDTFPCLRCPCGRLRDLCWTCRVQTQVGVAMVPLIMERPFRDAMVLESAKLSWEGFC